MVKDYTKFEIGRMLVEVNWNTSVMPCKKIRFTFDGIEQIIEREDLYAMMMIFGDDKQQEDLIPVTSTDIRMVRRLLKIRAKKDMKKGEVMVFPIEYPVTAATYERVLESYPKDFSPGNLSTTKLERDLLKKK